jgi:hypothetical protein
MNLPCRNRLLENLSSQIDAEKLYAILFLSVTALCCSASVKFLESVGLCPRSRFGEGNRETDAFGSPAKVVAAALEPSPGRKKAVGSIDGLTKQESEWTRGADLPWRSEPASAVAAALRPGVARLVSSSSSASFAADPIDAACTALGGRNLSMVTRDSSSEDSEDDLEVTSGTVW